MPKVKNKKAPAKKTATKKVVKKTVAPKKSTVKKSAPKKSKTKKTATKKTVKKTIVKKKAAVKKSPPKKKAAVKKVAPKKKTVATKAPTKKAVAKKAAPKATAAKKPAPKKKVPVKAASTKKATTSTPKAKLVSASRKQAALEGTDILAMGDTPIAPYKEKRGESYMGDEQAAHFSNILNTWKRALMQEVDRTVHHMQDEAGNFPDPTDRATQESEFTIELRTRDRERKLIKKIDESLGLIDSEDYGYCETCGIEIGIRRLEARPTATQCIDCKTLDEIKEKQVSR